jgi:hypothetical protein
MTHLQALIYIVVFIALVLLCWTSIKIVATLADLIAASIVKCPYNMNLNKETIMFAISLAIVLAYLLF